MHARLFSNRNRRTKMKWEKKKKKIIGDTTTALEPTRCQTKRITHPQEGCIEKLSI